MSYTVFYMNPAATPQVLDVVRCQMPQAWRLVTPHDSADFSRELRDADFIVVATEPIREEHLELAPRLKMIQHQGVGYERIDVDACKRRGIPLGLTPEGTTTGVAEHTILLILAVYKRIVVAANGLSGGDWMQWSLRHDSRELCGKTLGLIGFGRIGRAVAKRALAFDARVQFFDPFVQADNEFAAERIPSFQRLLSESDIVSLHAPRTPESFHLINAEALSTMKRGAILINTARGELVDETALIEALESGHVGGAGLDVFETEPLPADHPLSRFPNVVVTPHISAGTRDALIAKMRAVFANLMRYVDGDRLRNLAPETADMASLRCN